MTTVSTQQPAPVAEGENDNKFLTFRLGSEEYGVGILRVREIIGLIDITPLPLTPDFVKGVINLRGKIIPVIELRTKFGLPHAAYTEATCVIVVEASDHDSAERYKIGVIVDSVSEVLDIPASAIDTPPRFGGAVRADFITGMGKVGAGQDSRVIILLNMDRVLTCDEATALPPSEQNPESEAAAEAA